MRVAPYPPERLSIAVVIPLAREPDIAAQLDRLSQTPDIDELILVHAGDEVTVRAVEQWRVEHPAIRISIQCAPRGRASQMNHGATAARTDILLFLHADTVLPTHASAYVRTAIGAGHLWGRFDVRLSGAHPAFRVIERAINWRSALTSIATGDQAMFMRRDVFRVLGGFPAQALMEDIELSTRLKEIERPARIRSPVITSSRRWQHHGIVRTVLLMWLLRSLYALGVSPQRLARWYG